MSTRKRPRQPEAVEQAADNKAECPFSASVVDPKEKEKKNKKRRRTGGDEEESKIQNSPFSPAGTLKTHQTLDVHYKVEPARRWLDMTRYNSFVRKSHTTPLRPSSHLSMRAHLLTCRSLRVVIVNNTKYFSEGFIYVANDMSIEKQKTQATADGKKSAPLLRSADDWVARILEIRASDEHHVYARVFWMYWPDELPKGTRDGNGNKHVQGRQPYHGNNELVASNHSKLSYRRRCWSSLSDSANSALQWISSTSSASRAKRWSTT